MKKNQKAIKTGTVNSQKGDGVAGGEA